MAKEIICAFGTDIDSVAGWIGSYGGGDSPSDIQRGIFASEVGNIRLLNLFKKYNLKTSFFIPGHSIETFPDQVKRIVDEGHEIGAHGYLHENPIAMTPTQEEAVLVKCIDLIEKLSGKKPRGYVAPWWEMSQLDRRAAAEVRLHLRPQPGLPGFPALLCACRRQLEPDRLHEEGRGVDASAQARQGNRPRRDRRQLVCRRPAADDVHEEEPQQPRLRQSARHRGIVA